MNLRSKQLDEAIDDFTDRTGCGGGAANVFHGLPSSFPHRTRVLACTVFRFSKVVIQPAIYISSCSGVVKKNPGFKQDAEQHFSK